MTTFRVVFTRDSDEVVDVIDKITTDDYTRCIRRDSSHTKPSHSELDNSNGYLCGHEFFPDEVIEQSLALAKTKYNRKTKYPCPYIGPLYPADSGYLMWPIKRGNTLYLSGIVPVGPYYLILSKERQLVEVIVRGYNNNFLRCIRSRQAPKAPASDPYSKLFVPPPKPGYICGRSFFEEKVLKDNAEEAKFRSKNVMKSQYPIEYFGPPYRENCLIWPLMRDGSLYKRGKIGIYRLILKPNYNVIGVAMWDNGKLIPCDKKTIIANKNHDTSDYQCNTTRYNHQQLVIAAEEACKKMNSPAKNHYPAKYEGPGFNSDAPYFTYPVLSKGVYSHRNVGPDRVVINTNCEVVGALTSLFMPKKTLVKCHRLDDGPIAADFFGANAVT
ncbi:hypothetical protein EPUL_005412, partial [Erysiphe pulchra]